MPLKPGASKAVVSQNIREFHTGKTYAHTASKFGKERANKQAIAVALSTARKYKGKAGGGPNLGKSEMYKPPKATENFDPEHFERLATRGAMYGLRHEGMIHSSIPGRTDKLPMNVKSGSYILPADIPSALGQGNTMAGGAILKRMFSAGPYGLPTMAGKGRSGSGMSLAPRMNMMRPPSMLKQQNFGFAEGGTPDEQEMQDQNAVMEAAQLQAKQAMHNRPYMPRPDGSKINPPGRADGGTNHEQEGGEHVPIIAAGGEYIIHPDVVRDIGHGDIKAGHRVLDQFVLRVRKEHIQTLRSLKPPKK